MRLDTLFTNDCFKTVYLLQCLLSDTSCVITISTPLKQPHGDVLTMTTILAHLVPFTTNNHQEWKNREYSYSLSASRVAKHLPLNLVGLARKSHALGMKSYDLVFAASYHAVPSLLHYYEAWPIFAPILLILWFLLKLLLGWNVLHCHNNDVSTLYEFINFRI